MIEGIKTQSCPTHWARIYIAGPKHMAEDVCRKYTERGACINLYETNYIYKYGEQTGVVVELINYPRFPKTIDQLTEQATALGFDLLQAMSQGSFTVQTDRDTTYYDRRDGQ